MTRQLPRTSPLTRKEINHLSKTVWTKKQQNSQQRYRNLEIESNENPTHQEGLTNEDDSRAQPTEGPETTDAPTPSKEIQRNEEAKTDTSQKNKLTEDKGPEKPSNKANKRKKEPSKKKTKQKQSHTLEAGPNGKAQLAGSLQTAEEVDYDKDKEHEVVKDKAYYDKVVSDRTREFNFTLLLTDSTGTLEEKKSKALPQLKEEVKTFHLLDPTVVFNPWWRSSPIIARWRFWERYNSPPLLQNCISALILQKRQDSILYAHRHVYTPQDMG